MILLLVCGSVFAYMFQRTEPASTQFTPAVVACEVHDALNGDKDIESITVENTGNIDAYLRVRLVTYWVDGEGNVAPKPSPTLTVNETGNWVKSETSNTFYYKEPVAPEDSNDDTSNLLTTPITLKTEDGYKQVVDIFGEAIQAQPTAAVTDSWKVTLEADGKTINAAP